MDLGTVEVLTDSTRTASVTDPPSLRDGLLLAATLILLQTERSVTTSKFPVATRT